MIEVSLFLVVHAQSSRERDVEENTEFNVVREGVTKKHARRNMQYGVSFVRVAARFCKPYIWHAKGEQKPRLATGLALT